MKTQLYILILICFTFIPFFTAKGDISNHAVLSGLSASTTTPLTISVVTCTTTNKDFKSLLNSIDEITGSGNNTSRILLFITGIAILIILILLIIIVHIYKVKEKSTSLLEARNKEISQKNAFISEQKEELLAQAEELIRHQQDLERMVEERTKQLIIAKEKAEESSKLKTEFFNNLSHEIRTPLNAIIGFVNVLSSYNITEDEKVLYSNIIQESSDKLLKILNDVIEISELNTKQCKIYKNEVDLNTVFINFKNKYKARAEGKNLELRLCKSVNIDNKVIITTDKHRLKRIIAILLENAIKFTNTGYIEIGYEIKNHEIVVYVKDTGIGIDDKKKEKIFESFSQENIEISRDFGGLGIGLAIAKENVRLIGGKIGFESVKGKGTIFHFTLPYKYSKVVNIQETSLN
ncbi:MAG: HAMP domain-containing histidine kinase [Chlorobi bacterium]|nr:HAMP domain-containing histidine kinase [Chlorobiota bacterium]